MVFFEILASLLILTLLEIVLGIDNLVFLSILTEKLNHADRPRARRLGLSCAWVTRLIFLFSAISVTKLTQPLLYVFSNPVSWRDILLFLGGLFLIMKATSEIHREIDAKQEANLTLKKKPAKFNAVVLQIAMMDIIFSFDSVLTAIGLTDRFWLMALAITIAILMMVYASEQISRWIEKYPSIKMLALSFLILVGMTLVAEACDFHIPHAYVYFAMAFSLTVEVLNIVRGARATD